MDDSLKELGNRIKEARKAKKLNQQQFGDLIGKSIRTVQMYEKGESDISLSILYEIARKLDMPATALLGYDAPDLSLNSLSDVLNFVFQLSEVKNLNFHIDVKKPPKADGWECSLVFNGKDPAEYNADLCLALESYQEDIDTDVSGEKLKQRQDETLAYYMGCKLEK